MIETKPRRVKEDDDPNRCQGVFGMGQCHYEVVPGSTKCELHGGIYKMEETRKAVARQYNVAKWNARIEGFASNDGVKGLRDEIGIVRMILETVLNMCEDDFDLLLYSSKISDLVSRIESLVRSCHKLESSMGQLLDKTAALQLSGEIVQIIAKHVPDEDKVAMVAKDIAEALVRIEHRGLADG
jgi:hypothetical protein